MNYSEEADYIETIQPSAPGKSFNNDPKCFLTYCQMQAKGAVNEKQPNAAYRIRKHVEKLL